MLGGYPSSCCLPKCKAKHLFHSCFPAMLGKSMEPTRNCERQNNQYIQYGNSYEKLPNARVSIAAADLGNVHAVDTTNDGDGSESVDGISRSSVE